MGSVITVAPAVFVTIPVLPSTRLPPEKEPLLFDPELLVPAPELVEPVDATGLKLPFENELGPAPLLRLNWLSVSPPPPKLPRLLEAAWPVAAVLLVLLMLLVLVFVSGVIPGGGVPIRFANPAAT